jgi:hypothetical protein
MRGKADVPVSDVPVTTPQLRCRPVVRARLGPQLRAVPGLPRRMGKPCAGASGLANSRGPRALRADRDLIVNSHRPYRSCAPPDSVR